MEGTLPRKSGSFNDLWSLVLLVALATILATLAIWMLLSQFGPTPQATDSSDPMAGISQVSFIEETGIKIVRVNITLGGGAIGMRYQIVDPDKADVIHDENYPPGFIHESTGHLFNIPWHEHSHDRDLHTGIIYYEMTKNNGGGVKSGDLVTVLIGESRLEHVVVQ